MDCWGGSALTETAKAQTLAHGIGQQVPEADVTATQTSMVIPATSQSVSTSDQSQSTMSTSTDEISETGSHSETTNSVISHVAEASPTRVDSMGVTATASVTMETPSGVASAPQSVTVAKFAAAAATVPHQAQTYAFQFETNGPDPHAVVNQTSYAKGQTDAKNQIDKIVKNFTSTGVTGFLHIITDPSVPDVSAKITKNIQVMANLMELFYRKQNFQYDDPCGTPVWYNGEIIQPGQGNLYHDYNLGYADYLRAFAKGMSDWVAGIKAKAHSKDSSVADGLINYGNYDGSQLSGTEFTGILDASGHTTWKWLHGIFSKVNYADKVLAYQGEAGNVADGSVKAAVSAINFYTSIVAPVIINGVAHQALSDIRSIGGSIADDDYAPAELTEAVKLNGNITNMLKGIGLYDVLGTSIIQHVYEAIRTNVQDAIERNWTIGANRVLSDVYHNARPTASEAFYGKVKGYSEAQPQAILDDASKTTPLSVVAQAAGYAWYRKVIVPVICQAEADALKGQPRKSLEAIIQGINSEKPVLSADETDQILHDNVSHSFAPAKPYVRQSSEGVRTVITAIYENEYRAARAALTDYKKNPNLTITDQQATQYNFTNPADGSQFTTTNYKNIYELLQNLNVPYRAMQLADQQVLQQQGSGYVSTLDPQTLDTKYTTQYQEIIDFRETPAYMHDAQLKLWLESRYQDCYQTELAAANQALSAGKAWAMHNYDPQTGLVTELQQAGETANHWSWQRDGTAEQYHNFGGVQATDDKPGQIFSKGYQSMLAPIKLVLTSEDPKFKETQLAQQSGQIVHTLANQDVSLKAPEIPGWVAVVRTQKLHLAGQAPTTVTFTYHQAKTVTLSTLGNQYGTFNGNKAETQLQDTALTLTWSDGTTIQRLPIKQGWLTTDDQGSHVGHYTYHLTAAGAQEVLKTIGPQLANSSYILPEAAELMGATGTLTIASAQDSQFLPKLVGKPGTTVAGHPLTVADLVATATGTQGKDLTSDVTMGPVDWATPGTKSVQLSLLDPLSQQRVTATTTVEVISQESSCAQSAAVAAQQTSLSALTSADHSASEAMNSATSQWPNVVNHEQSLLTQSQTDQTQMASLEKSRTSLAIQVSVAQSALDSRNAEMDSRLISAQESAASDVVASITTNPQVDSATVSLVSQSIDSLSQQSCSLSGSQSLVAVQKSQAASQQLANQESQAQSVKDEQSKRSQASQNSQEDSRKDSQISLAIAAGSQAMASQGKVTAAHQSQAATLVADQSTLQSQSQQIASLLTSASDASANLAQTASPDAQSLSQTSQTIVDLIKQTQSVTTHLLENSKISESLQRASVVDNRASVDESLSQTSMVVASRARVVASVSEHSVAVANQAAALSSLETATATQSLVDQQRVTSVQEAATSLSQLFSGDQSLSVMADSAASLAKLSQLVASQANRLTSARKSLSAQAAIDAQPVDQIDDQQSGLVLQSTLLNQVTAQQTSVWTSLVEASLSAASRVDSRMSSAIDQSLAQPQLTTNQRSALKSGLTSLSRQAEQRWSQWSHQQTALAKSLAASQAIAQQAATATAKHQAAISQSAALVADQSQQVSRDAGSQADLVAAASHSLSASLASLALQQAAYVQNSQAWTTPTSEHLHALESARDSLAVQSVSVSSQSTRLVESQLSMMQASLEPLSTWGEMVHSQLSLAEESVSAESLTAREQLAEFPTLQISLATQEQELSAFDYRLQSASASVSTVDRELIVNSVASVKASQQQIAAQQATQQAQQAQHQADLDHASLALAQKSVTADQQGIQHAKAESSLATALNTGEQQSQEQANAQWSLIQTSLSARSLIAWTQQSTWSEIQTSLQAMPQAPQVQVTAANSAASSLSLASEQMAAEFNQLAQQSTSQEQANALAVANSQTAKRHRDDSRNSLAQVGAAVQSQQQLLVDQTQSLAAVSESATQEMQTAEKSVQQELTAWQHASETVSLTSAAAASLASAGDSLSLQSLSTTSVSLSNDRSAASMTMLAQAGQANLHASLLSLTSLYEASESAQSRVDKQNVTASQGYQDTSLATSKALASLSLVLQTANQSVSTAISQSLASLTTSVTDQVAHQQANYHDWQQQSQAIAAHQTQLITTAHNQATQIVAQNHQWDGGQQSTTSLTAQLAATAHQSLAQAASQQTLVTTSMSEQSAFGQSQLSAWTQVQQSLAQNPQTPLSQLSALDSAQASLSEQSQTNVATQSLLTAQRDSLTAASVLDVATSLWVTDQQIDTSLALIAAQQAIAHQKQANQPIVHQYAQASEAAAQAFHQASSSMADQVAAGEPVLAQRPTDVQSSLALTSGVISLSLLSVTQTSVSLAQDRSQASFALASQSAASRELRATASLNSQAAASASDQSFWRQAQVSELTSGQQAMHAVSQALQSVTQQRSLTSDSLAIVASQTTSASASLSLSMQVVSQLSQQSTRDQQLKSQWLEAQQRQSAVTSLQTSLQLKDSQLRSAAGEQSQQLISVLASQSAGVSQVLGGADSAQTGQGAWPSVATSLSTHLAQVISQLSQSAQTSLSEQSLSQKSTDLAASTADVQHRVQASLTSQSQAVVASLTATASQLQAGEQSVLTSLGATVSQLSAASTASLSLGHAHQPATPTEQAQVTSLLNQAAAETSTVLVNSVAQHSVAQLSVSEALVSLNARSQATDSQLASLTVAEHSTSHRSQTLTSVAQATSRAEVSVSTTSQRERSVVTSQSIASLSQAAAEDWVNAVASAMLNPVRPTSGAKPQTGQLEHRGHHSGKKHRHTVADQARFQRFRVTGVKKLGLYLSPNFSRHTRLTWYAQRTRTHQPMFEVLGQRQSRHGTWRYKVRDINRHSQTYGLVGYITTRSAYVQPTYYHPHHRTRVITVINARGINGYHTSKLTGRHLHYRQGQHLVVKRLVRHGQTTRYQLTNGRYITANKQWVYRGRPQNIQRLTLPHQVWRFQIVGSRWPVVVRHGATLPTTRYRLPHGVALAGTLLVNPMNWWGVRCIVPPK